MSDRPTESAQAFFGLALLNYQQAVIKADVNSADLRLALGDIDVARGLSDLSVGLRATYILLEEVKSLLQSQSLSR